ncbi:15681_t:CDS:1, partial [Gigaspora margarita]
PSATILAQSVATTAAFTAASLATLSTNFVTSQTLLQKLILVVRS